MSDLADPAVVFAGDADALLSFAELLEKLANGSTFGDFVELHHSLLFHAFRHTEIVLSVRPFARGMKRLANSRGGDKFEWILSADVLHVFSARVDAVGRAQRPCHNYLEVESGDDVNVVVSAGELDIAVLLGR